MLNKTELSAAWEEFVKIRDIYPSNSEVYIKARNVLLEHFYHLVFKVAENMSKKIKEVELDDLITWGTDGLFDAVTKFDPTLQIKFETYAIHRIRGAVLDNIRKVDWVPRLVRQRNSQLQKLSQKLEAELNRAPTDADFAAAMNMTVEEFETFKNKATPVGCISMYAGTVTMDDDGEGMQIEDMRSHEQTAADHVLRQEMFQKLLGRNFTPLERKIVYMHYYENMTMKEIATNLGYSESRISQMHGKILERLHRKVELNPQYMSGLRSMLEV